MVRFSRVRLAAVLMGPPSVIRCCTLRRHNGGNTLKSQDHHEGLRALPLKAMESSMMTGVFTPSHETGILVADFLPYAGSHDTRLGRESSWPQAPSGIHFFQAADGQGVSLRLTGRAAFLFRGKFKRPFPPAACTHPVPCSLATLPLGLGS